VNFVNFSYSLGCNASLAAAIPGRAERNPAGAGNAAAAVFVLRRVHRQEERMQHSRFLNIVNDAKKRVHEVSVDDVKTKMDRGEKFVLVDVREDSEFAKDHLP
jgi:hypothetical protein